MADSDDHENHVIGHNIEAMIKYGDWMPEMDGSCNSIRASNESKKADEQPFCILRLVGNSLPICWASGRRSGGLFHDS